MNKNLIIKEKSLYLVTDQDLSKGRSLLEIVKLSVQGGATIVQLREKKNSTRQFLEKAFSIKRFLKENNITFIINDRIDIAQAVQADGVHLGQDDMPVAIARSILGEKMIIGISVYTPEEAVKAEMESADYLGVGPIFSTNTKSDANLPIGIEGLKKIKERVSLPIVAIGGLTKDNVYDVIKNGADAAAVVSAIVSSDNPEDASKQLYEKILSAKK